MDKNIPVYDISLDSKYAKNGKHLGIEQIAYTANPAILTKGFAFKDESKNLKFQDESKLRVVAPIMQPMSIYRFDEDGEYFCRFSKEIIEELFVDFKERKDRGEIKDVYNLDHKSNEIAPAFELEVWIVGKDTKADRAFSEFGLDVPEGTVMQVSQFRDKEYYQKEIVEKGRTGYSIEGFLGLALSSQLKEKFNKMNNIKLEVIKNTSNKEYFIDGDIAVGSYVYSNQPTYQLIDGKKSEIKYPCWENIIELDNGQVLTLADSKIVEISQKQNLNMNKKKFMTAYLEDGTPVWIDKMEVGAEVWTMDENMEKAPLFDGEHKIKDGGSFVTVDGKITEVKNAGDASMASDKPADSTEKTDTPVSTDVPAEDKSTEKKMAIDPAVDGPAVMEIMKPVLDQIMQEIADLKALATEDQAEDATETDMKKTEKMSHASLSNYINFMRNTSKK